MRNLLTLTRHFEGKWYMNVKYFYTSSFRCCKVIFFSSFPQSPLKISKKKISKAAKREKYAFSKEARANVLNLNGTNCEDHILNIVTLPRKLSLLRDGTGYLRQYLLFSEKHIWESSIKESLVSGKHKKIGEIPTETPANTLEW